MTFKSGKVVDVEVIEIPISCKHSSRGAKAYFVFTYNGKKHSKNLNKKYCEILENKKIIQLKTNSDYSVFVYLDESFTIEFISIFLLLIIGIVFIFKKIEE
jgi:predicted protein tyrosine phosphatase